MLFVSHLSLNLTGWLFTSTLSLHCNIISAHLKSAIFQYHFPIFQPVALLAVFSLKQWDIALEMWVSFGRVCHAIGLAVSVHWTKIITCWNGEKEEIDIQLCFVERKILTRMQPVAIINTNNSNVLKVSIFSPLMHVHTREHYGGTLHIAWILKTHYMNTCTSLY